MLLKYENIITYEYLKYIKSLKFINYDIDKINGAVVI